jgi:hypothetical protein
VTPLTVPASAATSGAAGATQPHAPPAPNLLTTPPPDTWFDSLFNVRATRVLDAAVIAFAAVQVTKFFK